MWGNTCRAVHSIVEISSAVWPFGWSIDTETRRRVRVRDAIDGNEHEQNSDDDDHAHRYNPALLLTRLLLLSSLLDQIIQSRIDPSLINFAPERTIGSNDPISPVFPHDLDAVNGGPFPSVSRWNERKVR